jgi:hypothetical protein
LRSRRWFRFVLFCCGSPRPRRCRFWWPRPCVSSGRRWPTSAGRWAGRPGTRSSDAAGSAPTKRVETADATRPFVAGMLKKRKRKLLVAVDWVDLKGFPTLVAWIVLKGRSIPIGLGQHERAYLSRAQEPQRVRGVFPAGTAGHDPPPASESQVFAIVAPTSTSVAESVGGRRSVSASKAPPGVCKVILGLQTRL